MKLLAVTVTLAAAVAGCTSTTVARAPRPTEGAKTGGVLRVAITTPGSIDPGNDYEPMGDLVLRTMCDPLIAADPMTGTLRSSLVQSWTVSDSGQRLVLRLRKGLRFSDGRRLTADDVSYSLSRVASADYASAAASQLELIDGYSKVHGDVQTDNDVDRRRLKGVKALDEQSVEITLGIRAGDFLRVMTSRLVSPVPRASASADSSAFARRPVCAGPYSLKEPFRPGDRTITLQRVSGYHGVDTSLTRFGGGYADQIEFHIYPDARAVAAAGRAGEVDVAAAAPADVRGVQSVPGTQIEYLGFPTSTEPLFDKPAVRRALALAVNRNALVAQVFPGTRVPATGFLPPTSLPVFKGDGCTALPVDGDVPQAKTLLAEQGIDLRGLRAPFYVNTDGRNVPLARAVAAQWKTALGLIAVVTPSDFEGYLARGASAKGFDGPFRFSWSTPYPDPDGSLYPLFSTERIGRDNFSRYSSPAVDQALVRQAREAENASDRQLEYRRVEQLLCKDVPMLPLTFSLSRYLVSGSVSSAAPTYLDRTSGQPLLRELYLR